MAATADLAAATPAWASLLAAALPGTRQDGAALPGWPPLLPAPADANDPDAAPRHLLRAAGSLGLLRRAGYVPTAAPAVVPAPAAPETRPEIGPGGTAALRRMFEQDQYRGQLEPYLRAVTAAGRRLPGGETLLHVLDYLTPNARAGALAWVRPALGERGAWLAGLNPKWARALGLTGLATAEAPTDSADLTIWETGTWDERLAWLTARFETDAPAARGLLLAALPTEPARQQEPLLDLLADSDPLPVEAEPVLVAEPVLETLLKARGPDVRRRAAEQLARLPGAKLADRLWTRAEPLVKLNKALLGKDSLEVSLPTAWDKTWLLDGIEEKSDHYRWRFNVSTGTGHNATVGEAAVRLGTLMALVPVRRWLTRFGVDARELLALGLRSKEWQQPLLVGWAMSAVSTCDAEVIEAFLDCYFTKHEQIKRAASGVRWYALANALPHERRAAVVGPPLLAAVRLNAPEWPELVGLMPAPWPRELATAVLSAMVRTGAETATATKQPAELALFRQSAIQEMPEQLAPADLEWAVATLDPARLPPMHPTFRQTLDSIRAELTFRKILADSLL